MCRRVTCRSCGRPSFAGCGAHVEQVLGDVPRAERCHCGEKAKANDQARPENAREAAGGAAVSFFDRLRTLFPR